MEKNVKFLTLIAIAFALGLSVNNIAFSSNPINCNIAVVDINKVVLNSVQVKNLKAEKKHKNEELVKFIQAAKNEILKEKDTKAKQTLEQKYNNELATKKKAMDKEYAGKLKSIENNITNVIKEKAVKDNYNIVLSKNMVLYGGTDITEEVSKAVK